MSFDPTDLPAIHIIGGAEPTNRQINLQPYRPSDQTEVERLIAYTIGRANTSIAALATMLTKNEVFKSALGKNPGKHKLDELGASDAERVLIRGTFTHMHNHFPDPKWRHAMSGRHKAAFRVCDTHLDRQKSWGPQLSEPQVIPAISECLNAIAALHLCMTLPPRERDQMLADYMRGRPVWRPQDGHVATSPRITH